MNILVTFWASNCFSGKKQENFKINFTKTILVRLIENTNNCWLQPENELGLKCMSDLFQFKQ